MDLISLSPISICSPSLISFSIFNECFNSETRIRDLENKVANLEKSEIAKTVMFDSYLKNNQDLRELRLRILEREAKFPNSISLRAWEEIKKLSAEEFSWFEKCIHHMFVEICYFMI